MVDMEGFEVRSYRVVYYVETGYTDGCGLGRWETTVESHPFSDKVYAEKLRDNWLAKGKLKKMHWGEIRPAFSYGIFRIRRVEELITE